MESDSDKKSISSGKKSSGGNTPRKFKQKSKQESLDESVQKPAPKDKSKPKSIVKKTSSASNGSLEELEAQMTAKEYRKLVLTQLVAPQQVEQVSEQTWKLRYNPATRQPLPQDKQGIEVNLTAGDLHGKNTSKRAELRSIGTYSKTKIQQARQEFEKAGVDKSVFQHFQHLLLLEFVCVKPGQAQKLRDSLKKMLNLTQEQQANQEYQYFFQMLHGLLQELDFKFQVVSTPQNKVLFICKKAVFQKGIYAPKVNRKLQQFYWNFAPVADVKLQACIKFDVKEIEEKDKTNEAKLMEAGVSIGFFNLQAQYPHSMDLFFNVSKVLGALKQVFPLISVLANLKKARLKLQANSIDDVSNMIGWKCKHFDRHPIMPERIQIADNFNITYFNMYQKRNPEEFADSAQYPPEDVWRFMVKAQISLDEKELLLPTYLLRLVDYIKGF